MENKLLIRDNLQDTGDVPSRGGTYSSPDLIVHEQVADPQTFFKDTYHQDVNQPMNIRSSVNLIYVRVKNLSDTPKIAFVHMYASNVSLFLNPAVWKNQKLLTAEGEDFVQTGLIRPGEVGVTLKPFVFNAEACRNYCHVGYVLDGPGEPDIPDGFSDFNGYVNWVHGHMNVCMRNFVIVSGVRYFLENACEFSNPYGVDCSGLFDLKMIGRFPAGTRIEFQCLQLGIDQEKVLEEDVTEYTWPLSAFIPANTVGVATYRIALPEGQEGEPGAYAALQFYVVPERRGMNAAGPPRLIKVGQCTVAFENR